MANKTVNYELTKPQGEDFYDVGVFNNNADIIDTTLKAHAEPTFEDFTGAAAVPDAETALAAIKSKTTLGALFSNIKAFLMGAVTKSQIVNNLLATSTGNVLDATQGKALNDKIVALNSGLAVEDISSKITAINGTEIITLVAKRVQSLCFVSFTIKVPADSLTNLSVISLDTSIRPIAITEAVMMNAITGEAYAVATSRDSCAIRFSAVVANRSYDYRSEIKGNIIWFV